jgi:hypothetical protein
VTLQQPVLVVPASPLQQGPPFTLNTPPIRPMRLLHTLRAKLEAGMPPKQTRYPFSHTDSWEHIRRKAEAMLPPRAER